PPCPGGHMSAFVVRAITRMLTDRRNHTRFGSFSPQVMYKLQSSRHRVLSETKTRVTADALVSESTQSRSLHAPRQVRLMRDQRLSVTRPSKHISSATLGFNS